MNDPTFDHTNRLDDLSDLPLRPLPTLDGGAPDAASADCADPRGGRDPARVRGLRSGLPYGVGILRKRGRIRYKAHATLPGRGLVYLGCRATIDEAAALVADALNGRIQPRKTARRMSPEGIDSAERTRYSTHLATIAPHREAIAAICRMSTADAFEALVDTIDPKVRSACFAVERHDNPIDELARRIIAYSLRDATLYTIGAIYGVTAERVRQVEVRMLAKADRILKDHADHVAEFHDMEAL
jgi:hypothetical protein